MTKYSTGDPRDIPPRRLIDLMDEVVMDLMSERFNYPFRSSYSFSGEIVDTSKYDIVLKNKFLDKEIERKEEELRRLEESHKHYNTRADELERLKRQEIDNLKAQKNKRLDK